MDLFDIVRNGSIEELRAALSASNIEQTDKHGFTPLMLAETAEKTYLLLERGALVNAQTTNGLTALMCAVQAPDKGLDVVRALIEYGANVNLNQPLVLAEAIYLPLLVAHGADVNGQNPAGETRLIIAAYNLDYESAQFLLEHGANPHLKNVAGKTAYSIAQAVRKRTADSARRYADDFLTLLSTYGAKE